MLLICSSSSHSVVDGNSIYHSALGCDIDVPALPDHFYTCHCTMAMCHTFNFRARFSALVSCRSLKNKVLDQFSYFVNDFILMLSFPDVVIILVFLMLSCTLAFHFSLFSLTIRMSCFISFFFLQADQIQLLKTASAYRLKRYGDRIQPFCTPFPI